MELEALGEQYAAYTGDPDGKPGDPRKALNRLLTVDSWGKLVKFLKSPLCLRILPGQEEEPLSGRLDPNSMYGQRRIQLAGSLERSISRDPVIDALDDLARRDLLRDPTLREVWVPEVLDFIGEARRFLTLAAVALGSPPPEDLYGEYVSREGDAGRAPDAEPRPLASPGGIRAVSIDSKYVPDMRLLLDGYYLADIYPDINPLGEMAAYDLDLTADEVAAFRDWVERNEDLRVSGSPFEPRILFDARRHSDLEAVRRLAGDLVADYLNQRVEDLEGWPYVHHSPDDPSADELITHYIPGEGFVRPSARWSPGWAQELWKVATDAIYDGRVTLCEYCHTPIVLRSRDKWVDFCCDSHKTMASQRRRERAIALCASGVPLEEAVDLIGPRFRESVEKWYAEAQGLAQTS